MNRKIHAQSTLLQLTEEQQEMLYDWLLVGTYQAVQERLAAPEPEGFGIHVHVATLQRFFARRSRELEADSAKEVGTNESIETGGNLVRAAERSLAGRAYNLASSGLGLDGFGEAARCVGTLKELEVKQGYLRVAEEHLRLAKVQAELEREKFEINTARLALEHAAKLKEIIHNHALDDEDKIRQSRRVVFTKIPEDELNKLPAQAEKVSGGV